MSGSESVGGTVGADLCGEQVRKNNVGRVCIFRVMGLQSNGHLFSG